MYLLDTNVCLDFAKGRSERLRARVRLQNGRDMAISSVTLAELRFGARRADADRDDELLLSQFVSVLRVLDFDRDAAEAYGDLGGRVAIRRGSFDRLIAAHALASGLTLVTNNEADFADVPGLVVENWTR